MPTPVLDNKTPFEKLFQNSLTYNLIRVFGCLCVTHVRNFNKYKFDYKSKHCVFIGYSLAHIGYKCIDKMG